MWRTKFSSIFFLVLMLPLVYINSKYDGAIELYSASFGTLALVAFVLFCYFYLLKINKFIARAIVVAICTMLFFIRLIIAFVYDFSGRGFTSEFFAHLEVTSVIVAFKEYGLFILFILIFLMFFIKMLLTCLDKGEEFPLPFGLLVFVSSIIGCMLAEGLPERRLFNAYARYNQNFIEVGNKLAVRDEVKLLLKPIRGLLDLPIEKREIVAQASDNPKNIIIIYLESFSDILTHNENYKNLTPNLNRLKENNISFSNNFSSAYVTIEGVANSQCGTLMNMDGGNNSLTTKAGRQPNLPCMGDVLNVAGYNQVFLGGANLEFAGKGAFLAEHGYTQLIGLNNWIEAGFTAEGTWGLTDSDLFDQAFKRILKLHESESPFNVTLLTLGTHIPGFTYEGCQEYKGMEPSNKFLSAIHCSDYLVGKFIDKLKENQILKNTIVYIQGDHTIFPTSDMKDLFFDEFDDKRIFNVIITPDNKALNYDEMKATSSMSMASNVLDLLEIEHNVDFVFSRSDFREKNTTSYLMTRYFDHYGLNMVEGKQVENECNSSHELNLPLDPCEKKIALNAVYRLGATYAQFQRNDNLCEMGVTVSINNTEYIDMQWGGVSVGNEFYSNGFKLKSKRAGFYLTTLDNHDRILGQFFFDPTKLIEKKFLEKLLSASDFKYFMFSNLTSEALSQLNLDGSPIPLLNNKAIYAENIGGKQVVISEPLIESGSVKFTPNSCELKRNVGSPSRSTHSLPKEEDFCPITRWGPKIVELDSTFNEQPNGTSAFWLETQCAPSKAVIRLNGVELTTLQKLPIVTASLLANTMLIETGSYMLDLYDKDSGRKQEVGVLTVKDKEPKEYRPFIKGSFVTTGSPPLLIAHAGGGYENHTDLNSLEALNYNYKLGHRFFEVDFSWTSDNHLVAIHDWNGRYKALFNQSGKSVPSLDDFMSLDMNFNQTQINLHALDAWLKLHPDAYIITDVKKGNVKALALMNKHMNHAPNQIIPQLYDPLNYSKIKKIGYKDIIFTLYATKSPPDSLLKFIKTSDLYAVTIHPDKSGFKEIINGLFKMNVPAYVHTYDNLSELKYYLSLDGVDGIYTNFLYLNERGVVVRQK